MTNSLQNFINNLSEGINRIKCKFRHGDKNVKYVELDISIATVFYKDMSKEYKRFCCNKNYKHKFDEKWKERFFNT